MHTATAPVSRLSSCNAQPPCLPQAAAVDSDTGRWAPAWLQVLATLVRGSLVYSDEQGLSGDVCGGPLLRRFRAPQPVHGGTTDTEL